MLGPIISTPAPTALLSHIKRELKCISQILDSVIYKHLESEDSDTEEDYTEQLNYIGGNLCGVRDRLIDLHDDMEKYVEDEDDEDTLFYLAAMWGKYIAVRRFCELDVDDLCFVPFAPLLRTGRWYVSVPNVANTLRAIMDENPDAAIELSNSIFSKD